MVVCTKSKSDIEIRILDFKFFCSAKITDFACDGIGPFMKLWSPSTWVSLIPNGLGQVKPNHYWDMLKVALKNRDALGYAWRILRNGVCDGCALGTTGMRDFTMTGVHLCMVRLHLMRLNTAP